MKASLWRRVFTVISTPSGLCFNWEPSKSSTSRGPCHNAELKYRPLRDPRFCRYRRTEDPYSFVFRRATGIHTCNFQMVLLYLAWQLAVNPPALFTFWPLGFLTHRKTQVQRVSLFSQGSERITLPSRAPLTGQLIRRRPGRRRCCARSGIQRAAILYFLCICNFQLKRFCGIWLGAKAAKKNNYPKKQGT